MTPHTNINNKTAQPHEQWLYGVGGQPPTLTSEYLPEILRGWITDICEAAGAPLEFGAASAICMIGSLIGNRACLQAAEHNSRYKIYPNLWGGIVAPPGSRKSPVLHAIMEPLWQLQADSTERVYLAQDATWEAAHALFASGFAPGLFVCLDELNGFLHGLERHGQEPAKAFWLQVWNGDGHFMLKRVIRGQISAWRLNGSIFGGIQPEPLHRYISSSLKAGDDGFLQRFQLLLASPQPHNLYPIDRLIDLGAQQRAFDAIGRIDQMLKDSSLALNFNTQAQRLWNDWLHHRQTILNAQSEAPVILSLIAKIDKVVGGIALIDHLLQTSRINETSGVAEESVFLGLKWAELALGHWCKIYQEAQTANTGGTIEGAILTSLQRRPRTARELRQNSNRLKSVSSAVVEQTLGRLQAEKRVRCIGGKWFVV